jgi:hypothetical protein
MGSTVKFLAMNLKKLVVLKVEEQLLSNEKIYKKLYTKTSNLS